jgi:hypothetical protein
MSNQTPMLKKKDKENIPRPDFIKREQLVKEMDDLARHYETDSSKADLAKTRIILDKVSSLSNELAEMRDENM